VKVGNPRNPEAKMGPVVNKTQQASCLQGLAKLKGECEVLFGDDKNFLPLDADPQKSAFVQPALLSCKNGLDAKYVHDVEVFGPLATLVAYDDRESLIAITRRDWDRLSPRSFPTMRISLAKRFLESGIFTEESWPLTPP